MIAFLGSALLGLFDLSLLFLGTVVLLLIASAGLVLIWLACWGDDPDEGGR